MFPHHGWEWGAQGAARLLPPRTNGVFTLADLPAACDAGHWCGHSGVSRVPGAGREEAFAAGRCGSPGTDLSFNRLICLVDAGRVDIVILCPETIQGDKLFITFGHKIFIRTGQKGNLEPGYWTCVFDPDVEELCLGGSGPSLLCPVPGRRAGGGEATLSSTPGQEHPPEWPLVLWAYTPLWV